MDWQDRMNRAIAWIEGHLTKEIEWQEAAREANCSLFHFLRMFEVVTGMTAGDYVRRRRLSMAAMELASTDAKIIDVALRYGYDSPDAFADYVGRFRELGFTEFLFQPPPPEQLALVERVAADALEALREKG